MQARHFFRISWLLQLVVGAGLFGVSFLLQGRVMAGFLVAPALAWSLTGMLEFSKALAIVWHRYMSESPQVYPRSTRLVSGLFRTGLLALSLLSSLLFVGGHLDRPRLAEAREQDLAALDRETTLALDRLEQSGEQRLAALRERAAASDDDALAGYRESIQRLEARLDEEMNNVVRGEFKGPRYREIERRLEAEKANMARAASERAARLEAAEKSAAREIDNERQRILEKARAQRRRIMTSEYGDDERAADPRIAAFISLSRGLFGVAPGAQGLVFAFAILISLLLELGIMLSFDTLTVTVAPALRAEHQHEIDKQIFGAKLATEAEKETARYQKFMEKLEKRARATVETAEKMEV